jgi:hypothetical protein
LSSRSASSKERDPGLGAGAARSPSDFISAMKLARAKACAAREAWLRIVPSMYA